MSSEDKDAVIGQIDRVKLPAEELSLKRKKGRRNFLRRDQKILPAAAGLEASQLWQSVDRAENWSAVKASAQSQRPNHPSASIGTNPRVSRGAVIACRCPIGREFVIRPFLRGGFIRHLSSDWFVHLPGQSLQSTRPFRELEVLARLFEHGCSVARPTAALVETKLSGYFYRGWLVTELVPGAENFLALACGKSSPVLLDNLQQWSFAAGAEARKVLKLGIFHLDLHLGNVLINGEKRVVLIDFDKAQQITSAQFEHYKKKTASRWARSIEKHFSSAPQLGSILQIAFNTGLSANANSE